MVDFFNQINQDSREWAALSPDEQFRKFTAELNKMSQTDARFWLDEINDSAVNMYETLVKNDGEFLKLADDANRLGLSLTSGQFELIGETRRELETLAATGSGIWQQTLAAAAPAISSVSKGVRQWINDQAQAAGGFRQLGVVIVETVLQAVVDTAYTLQSVMNTAYQGAEKLAAMTGKVLNPGKAGIERQLANIQARMQSLNTEFVKGLGDAPDAWKVPDESLESYRELEAEYNTLRRQLTDPFNFADSLQNQVSGIVSTIKSAQFEVADNAPANVFGTVTLDDYASASGKKANDADDDKNREKIAERLEALKNAYKSETEVLKDKLAYEKTLLNDALAQKLLTEDEYKNLRLNSERDYSEQLAEIESDRAEKSVNNLEALREHIEESATSFNQVWSGAFDSFSTGFGNSVASAIVDGESLGDSIKGVAKGMAKNMISALIQIGAQRLALWATEKTIGAAGAASMAAAVAGEATAGVNLAMLNAYQSAAAIPLVGWQIAPGAAAAAGATTAPMAQAAIAAAATTITGARALGGEVKAGSTYLVGERGAELFVPNADGQITSHEKLAAAARGAGSSRGVQSITLAPSIVVESGASQSNDEFLAENVAAQVFNMLLDDANTGGLLSRALGSR